MDIKEFASLVPAVCERDTAAGNGRGWTSQNPTFGHCAVVSLLAQELFGGELIRISLKDTRFAEGGSHYSNRLPDGTTEDFTLAQFGGWVPEGIPEETRTREYLLSSPDTRARYEILKARFNELITLTS